MRKRYKVPVILDCKNKGERVRYQSRVQTYCLNEFENGLSDKKVFHRLRKTGGFFSIWWLVETEYLHFLGVTDRKIQSLRKTSVGFAACGTLASLATGFMLRHGTAWMYCLFALVFGSFGGIIYELSVKARWKRVGSSR